MDYKKINKLNQSNLRRESSEQLLSITQLIDSIVNSRDHNLNSQLKLQMHNLSTKIKTQNHYLYDDSTNIFNS